MGNGAEVNPGSVGFDNVGSGTPDDQRMEHYFAETFVLMHIGTIKEKSSHSRVTNLNFIRLRATQYLERPVREYSQQLEQTKELLLCETERSHTTEILVATTC